MLAPEKSNPLEWVIICDARQNLPGVGDTWCVSRRTFEEWSAKEPGRWIEVPDDELEPGRWIYAPKCEAGDDLI